MKSIKIYLIIVSCLLIVAIALGIYIWIMLQKINTDTHSLVSPQNEAQSTTSHPKEPIVVQTHSLSESQQKILKTFGYTSDTLTITPTMITCAENAVGKTRLDEILKGSTPNAIESVKLLPCLGTK